MHKPFVHGRQYTAQIKSATCTYDMCKFATKEISDMQSTLNLLERALEVAPMPEWTKRLQVHRNALRNARESGHLSPVIAGNLALALNEDPTKWMTLAVLEGEKASPAKDMLMKRMSKQAMLSLKQLYQRAKDRPLMAIARVIGV